MQLNLRSRHKSNIKFSNINKRKLYVNFLSIKCFVVISLIDAGHNVHFKEHKELIANLYLQIV